MKSILIGASVLLVLTACGTSTPPVDGGDEPLPVVSPQPPDEPGEPPTPPEEPVPPVPTPPGEPTPPTEPIPTPPEEPGVPAEPEGVVTLLEFEVYDGSDARHAYGLIRNDTNTTIEDIRILYSFTDSGGVEAERAEPLVSVLMPGEVSPFIYTDEYAEGGQTRIPDDASVADVTWEESGRTPVRLPYVYEAAEYSDEITFYEGGVTNTTAETLEGDRVAMYCRDAGGKLLPPASGRINGYVEEGDDTSSSIMPPGRTVWLEVVIDVPVADISSCEAVTQSFIR